MPVEAIAGKILSEHGELTAVVTILHDRREAIEKARLYEQLKQASDELERKIQAATADIAQQNELLRRQAIELEQASALKSQFLANMSHEFRTPLNAMLGYTSMLLQGVAGELRAAGQAPARAHRVERPPPADDHQRDSRHLPHRSGPDAAAAVDVQDARSRRRGEVRARADHHALEADRDAARCRRICVPISSDRQKVKQILLNLLSNALKFTHQGGVTIARAAQRAGADGDACRSTDTGIGIAAADQDRIFEDFRQLDNSPTRAYGGTGLGLSICRRLAQMLGGRITRAEPGRQGLDVHPDAADQRTEMTTKPERPRVLLVDDYPDAREMYTEYLEFSGFDVVEAGNGMEALQRAVDTSARHHPDGPVAAGDGRLGGDAPAEGRRAHRRRFRSSR